MLTRGDDKSEGDRAGDKGSGMAGGLARREERKGAE